ASTAAIWVSLVPQQPPTRLTPSSSMKRSSQRASKTFELSPREFALLEFLMRNEGRVVTRTQILDHVWGYDFAPDSNLVDVYVTYLRRKVDRGHDRRLIRTVRGAGYALGD
ncbi:hypothetical protein LCGC14_1889780, partial [marine sediment metagenome]